MTEIKKTTTLYLSGWQKRMVKDYLKVDVHKLKIGNIKPGDLRMYRQPTFEHVQAGHWLLYLTDGQINRLSEEMGIKANISALNVSPEMLKSGAISFEGVHVPSKA